MGEVNQYHITMLVTSQQEDAIRTLFKHRDWPCLINVLSHGIVSDIMQKGLKDVFPVLIKGEDDGDEGSSFKEIKSEITNEDNCVDNSDISFDSDVKKEKHASENDPDISDNDFNVSDNKTQISDDNVQSTNNTPEMSDNEKTYSDNEFGSYNSSSSDEGSGKHMMNSADKEKDSSRKYNSKTKSNKRNCKQKKTKFKCSICDMYLCSKPSLQRHCQRRHQEEWFEFKCKDCSCMFKKVEELWKHRNEVKHEPPKVKPKFSEKKNLSPEELEQLGHLKCNACGKILPSRRLLRRHFYSDHREWMPDPICAVCGTEFKTRQELWKHKRELKHNDSLTLLQTYQCEECGKILTGGYHSFKLHQKYACKEEGSEPQAKCDICGSMFKSQTHVQQHKQRTHVESPVVCDICGALCKNKHALNSHKRRHDEKNKKFVCDECGKAFLTGLLLKMHVRTHTKEKPFKCPLCNYRCAIKQNIQKHSVNVHKTQVKCSEIVIVKEAVVKQSSKKASALSDDIFATNSGRNDGTFVSNGKTNTFPGRGNKTGSQSNESIVLLNRRAYHSDVRVCQSSELASLTDNTALPARDKAVLISGSITNEVSLSHDRKRQTGDSESYLKSQGNNSQFSVMEGAYNLTMCRQRDMPSSDRTQKGAENFSIHVNNNNASTAGSYMEMMNCSLNPLSYTQSNIDPPQYPYPWSDSR